jgi:hypothetical protein
MYLSLIELGIQFLLPFLTSLKWGKAPAEVIQSVQGAIDSLTSHKLDMITKSNLDAMRG